jgi:hypothetical protein
MLLISRDSKHVQVGSDDDTNTTRTILKRSEPILAQNRPRMTQLLALLLRVLMNG